MCLLNDESKKTEKELKETLAMIIQLLLIAITVYKYVYFLIF